MSKIVKTKMVDPRQLEFWGFNKRKIKQIRRWIPLILKDAQRRTGTKRKFPSPIVAMSEEEIYEGQNVRDAAHPGGAGHGLYYIDYQLVKINPNMEPLDILANVLHENIHHLRPDLSELQTKELTGEIMADHFGEVIYGQPYGDENLAKVRSNPIRRRNFAKDYEDSKGRHIPAKYLKGLSMTKIKARIKEIGKRRDEYDRLQSLGRKPTKSELEYVFRPFKTDKGVKKKASNYTVEAKNRGFEGNNVQKAEAAYRYYLKKRPTPQQVHKIAKILDKVSSKGIAAWASGGHRPGANQFNWANARVNSVLVGGKAFWTADNKLAKQFPKKMYEGIVREAVHKP